MISRGKLHPDVEEAFPLQELRTFRTPGRNGTIYAVVAHNPELRLISDFWAGDFATPEAFRHVLTFIAEQIEAGPYRYWLADLRFLSSSFAESGPWLVDTLMPRVLASGLAREAVVLPPERYLPAAYDVHRAGMQAIADVGDPRLRGFTDVAEAKRWLLG